MGRRRFGRRVEPISAWLEARFAECRPRAVAALTRQFRDVDLAEEAFGDACLSALTSWRRSGQPDDPFAWLLAVARNKAIDRLRKTRRSDPDTNEIADTGVSEEDHRIEQIDERGLRDDVLRLLFICCHPALSRQDQMALALKIVAGLSVDAIARAFLVKPKTMEQRITRAKRTVAQNPVPFETPDLVERGRRLNDVSLMIYLLFNEGWVSSAGDAVVKLPLCEEAIRLGRLLLNLFPGMAELMGLLALMLYQHARVDARTDDAGALLALPDQDRSKWDGDLISEANLLLQKAARHGPPGSFQIQAAIAGVNANAASDAETDWERLENLYEALNLVQPSPVVRLNHAVAVSKTKGAAVALDLLAPLETDLATYRWFHTTRAGLLEEAGDPAAALKAYRAALGLQPTAPERRAIEENTARCQKNIGTESD